MHNFYLGEKDFASQMKNKVLPEMEKIRKRGIIRTEEQTELSYWYSINPEEKGAVVISHGFCEFARKFDEVEYYFYQAGYSVFIMEHRGHGNSMRLLPDTEKVHVNSYDDYAEDLHLFMEQVVKRISISGNYILYAHSMGGAIGSLYLEKYPGDFKRAVLTSPMLQMNYGKIPKIAVQFISVISWMFFWDDRYAPGQHGFDGIPHFDTSSCLSESRYNYVFHLREENPQYRTYGGTYGWSRAGMKATKEILKKKNLEKIKIPVLLFQAGRDTMVKPGGQNRFAKLVEDCRLVVYPDSKHEIFNATEEIRKKYYEEIFCFLES